MRKVVVSVGDFVADTDSLSRISVRLEGWTDAAPITDGITDKAQQDGGWDATGYYRPRIITVNGMVDEVSRLAALQAADALNALSPHVIHTLTVADPDVGLRQASVRVMSGAVLTWLSPACFRYAIQLKAPDHLKYGAPTFTTASLASTAGGAGLVFPLAYPLDYGVPAGVTPGAVSLANAGTATYWPRLRIDGPVPNPTVTLVETGDWVRFGGTVGAGQWLDIDCANRRVLLNGQVSVRHLVTSSGAWLAVPPGGGSISWTADAADPAALLNVWGFEGAWA